MLAIEKIEEILVKEKELEKVDLLSQLEFVLKFFSDALTENDLFMCFTYFAVTNKFCELDFPLGDEGVENSGELRLADSE